MALSWFRDICEAYLDFSATEWDALISDAKVPGRNGAALQEFLSAGTPKGTPLYVYATSAEVEMEVPVTTMKEVEVEEVEEIKTDVTDTAVAAEAGPEGGSVVPTTSVDGSQPVPPPAVPMSANAELESKEKEAADALPSGQTESGSTLAVPPPAGDEGSAVPAAALPPRTKMIEVTTMEIRKVKTNVVTACLRVIPSNLELSVAYFIKTKADAITPPSALASASALSALTPSARATSPTPATPGTAAPPPVVVTLDDYMADAVEYGSVSSDLLSSMEVVVREVFTPFLEPQLGGKTLGDDLADDANEGQSVVSGMPLGTVAGQSNRTGIFSKGGSIMGGGNVRGSIVAKSFAAPSVTGGSSGINLNTPAMGGMGSPAGQAVSTVPVPAEEDVQVAHVSDNVKGEFRSALHRFTTVITHTIQQVSGDVRLDIPPVAIEDPVAASQDETVKAILVDAVENWTHIIGQLVSTVTDKDKGSRPLQEIEFWRNRNATLSTIYEQLNHPTVKGMLTTLEIAREPALDPFRVCTIIICAHM
jgi:hypothetical protein